MEEYIETALAAGHIRPSMSPAAAGFFFVGKKDGGLCPCMDYRGLNAITIPYPYSLPLVPAALEQLRGARIFTKLDFRSTYNLVRIKKGDEWKTTFHTTHRHYEYRVIPFGLTNAPAVFQALINGVFQDLLGKWVIAYIDDILVYSASLEEHVLHVRETRPGWPFILRHPDPDLPFVVEVDASSSGLGPVLSQRHGEPGKLHPCAFYSRKLTTAKANYDVGNRELLAIKAALEEWCHWLEGARHTFQVLTDHHNLEYLRGAKRLNPRQARWALFFTRFRFMVTYRSGSKNGKVDVLSRKFERANEPVLTEPILPPTAILAQVCWKLVEEIQRTHAEEPLPAGCPPTKVFVPLQFRTQVMQWVHEAPSSGHPGVCRSTQLVRRRFWWPSLALDVERHIQACPSCAQAGRTSLRTSYRTGGHNLPPECGDRCVHN
ncbi:hypothetical protein QTP86_033090 [Hemibagrus guttatus]|nr:hypothetical protein QTP86_033090 [Hemibagrus guttatus]